MRAALLSLALGLFVGPTAATAAGSAKPQKGPEEALKPSIGPAADVPSGLSESNRITVTASGQSSIKPDVAEVRASVSGTAAMAADALRKFGDNRRRAIEAIMKLKFDNLSIEGGGLSLSSANANAQRLQQMFGGNQNAGTPGHVTVSENLVLRLASIDRMKEGEPAKAVTAMIDAAKDAGMTLGGGANGLQSQLVRFRSTKLEEAHDAAVQSAIKAAYHKAEALAAVSKAKIVRIVSTREIAPPPMPSNSGAAQNWFMMAAMSELGVGGGDSDEGGSPELKSIPVNVTVEVQFAATGGQSDEFGIGVGKGH